MIGNDVMRALLAMSVKDGVELDLLHPVMERAIIGAARVAVRLGIPNVITAGTDGEHMTGSLHYDGLAIDVRRADWPAFDDIDRAGTQCDLIKTYIGSDFDVIIEGTHIHIEYDPKPGRAA